MPNKESIRVVEAGFPRRKKRREHIQSSTVFVRSVGGSLKTIPWLVEDRPEGPPVSRREKHYKLLRSGANQLSLKTFSSGVIARTGRQALWFPVEQGTPVHLRQAQAKRERWQRIADTPHWFNSVPSINNAMPNARWLLGSRPVAAHRKVRMEHTYPSVFMKPGMVPRVEFEANEWVGDARQTTDWTET